MRPLNRVKKEKERLVWILDNIEELNGFDFTKYIPKGARKVEISCKENKECQLVLEIDFITKLEASKI